MPLCERAYLSIIITIIPLWIILTTLIVFVLLTFHKSLRSTKIYDDCTKLTAQYVYYIELRTGDTSSTYNRRRTTLTIDMFDDNQTTLARIAIPGHVIFGRKDMPTGIIEDEKFFELRVTRFWLYRSIKLKKINTIRLTHSCLEPEARIMVYGLELRTNEIFNSDDEHKQFFPILSYISAFGSTGKPNACFDVEPNGSITALGGHQDENSFVSFQLSKVDYIILINLSASIIWCLASFKDLFLLPNVGSGSGGGGSNNNNSFDNNNNNTPLTCLYRGSIIGLISYFTALIIGLIQKYYIKFNYALNIGIGIYAFQYYSISILILIMSTCIWIYTTVNAYKYLCHTYYGNWILTISFSVVEVVFLTIIQSIIIWLIYIFKSRSQNDQYLLPDEYSIQQAQQQEPPSKGKQYQHQQHLLNLPYNSNYYQSISQKNYKFYNHQANNWQPSYSLPTISAAAATPPTTITPPVSYQSANYLTYPNNQQQQQQQLVTLNANYLPQQQATKNVAQLQTIPFITTITPSTPHSTNQTITQPQQQQQQQQSSTLVGAGGSNPGGKQATGGGIRRVGSNESTGSTYYQQLMKNKGGVKSISQYGELLKQKKQQQRQHHDAKHNK